MHDRVFEPEDGRGISLDEWCGLGVTPQHDPRTLTSIREGRYGHFRENASVAQALKIVLHGSPNWMALPDAYRESLDLIASKLGRICSGDPFYTDNWVDIAGYADLIVQEIERE